MHVHADQVQRGQLFLPAGRLPKVVTRYLGHVVERPQALGADRDRAVALLQ